MTTVQIIGALFSVLIVALGGPPVVKLVIARFFKRSEKAIDATVEIAKQKEITQRHKLDLDVKLEGTTQKQVEILHEWMREQLVKLNEINLEQAGVIGTQEAEIKHLRSEVERLAGERAAFKLERDLLEAQCREVISQGKDLTARLEAKDAEVVSLRTELKQSRARNEEITRRLDDEMSRSAQLANENERLRVRGGTERAG